MSNTVHIDALDDGTFKVSVRSEGERDLSAKISADELDTLVAKAHNDVARGVLGTMDEPEHAAGGTVASAGTHTVGEKGPEQAKPDKK